jgi:D-alanine-D-alanine ligase
VSSAGRVGLLFGGRSVEHEVSVTSARSVSRAFRDTRWDCLPIGVTGDGRWLGPGPSAAVLADPSYKRVDDVLSADVPTVVPGMGEGRLLECTVRGIEPIEVDAVFPLVHGWGGEDGRLQGVLELAAIPYVGPDVLGSAAAMDKAVARTLFEAAGIEVAPWVVLRPGDRPDGIVERLGLPLFVKPANGGSSVGITRVARESQLGEAIDRAFACDRKVVIERGIDAREIECAVLGNDDPRASVVGEIAPTREFYDYAAKYLEDTSRLYVPSDLEPRLGDEIRRRSLAAFRALDLSGLARVDFLVERRTDRIFLNEVNSLPGFTPISMFPKLWEASGLPYPKLVERLVELALERSRQGKRLRTRLEAEDVR